MNYDSSVSRCILFAFSPANISLNSVTASSFERLPSAQARSSARISLALQFASLTFRVPGKFAVFYSTACSIAFKTSSKSSDALSIICFKLLRSGKSGLVSIKPRWCSIIYVDLGSGVIVVLRSASSPSVKTLESQLTLVKRM